MPRLPLPGSDDGTWGDILNEYLTVEHNTDGTLKKAADIAAKYIKPATGIPESDLTSDVQTKLNSGGGNSDATTLSKGIIQLAGDLGGTAAVPTVPGLTGKAPIASPTFTGTVTLPGNPIANLQAATKQYVDSLSQTIYVKNYGATGDGATDDTSSINDAKNAAGAKGTIVFTTGTYLVGGLSASVAGQHWILQSGAVIKLKNTANTPVIDVTANEVTIDGSGTLNGNRANQTDAATGQTSCVRIVSRSNVKVSGLIMRSALSHAVYIDNSTYITIHSNNVSGSGPAGNQKQILVYDTVGNSSNIRITDNTVDSTSPANGCIAITTWVAARVIQKLHITGNYCKVGNAGSTATLGIELFTSGTASIRDAIVSNNIIEGPSGVVTSDQLYGISIGGTTSSASNGIRNVSVAGNSIRNCPYSSIEIVGNNVSAVSNACVSSGALSVNAISTTGGLAAVTVTGNSMLDSVHTAYAIHLQGGVDGLKGCVISGNVIRNAAAASVIYTEGVITGALISGNTVTGCAGVPANLGGIFTDSVVSDNVFDLTGVGGTIDGILLGSITLARIGINNNTIRGASRIGIYGLSSCTDISIVGNRISNCQNGIRTDAAMIRWSVVGNTVYNNSDRGLIFTVASTDLSIASNIIHSNPGGNYFTVGSTFLPHVINGAGG